MRIRWPRRKSKVERAFDHLGGSKAMKTGLGLIGGFVSATAASAAVSSYRDQSK